MSIQRLQAHYGFTRMPFGRSLAPAMLHRHAGHAEAVARITWCVDQHALGVITGEVGAGKTVAVRAATAALDTSRHVVIYLPNPSVGVRGMLHHIVGALGQVPSFYTATLAPQAADALAAEHAERGRTPVVVIDEAHLLDNQQLEAIRMLTNHDMDSGSPFAALLVGQPTLRHRLRLGVLAALDQRISVRYALAGMTAEPTPPTTSPTTSRSPAGPTPCSATDAITVIHNAARGYPRAVNNLADQRPHRRVRPRRARSSTRKPPASPSPKMAATKSLTCDITHRRRRHHTDECPARYADRVFLTSKPSAPTMTATSASSVTVNRRARSGTSGSGRSVPAPLIRPGSSIPVAPTNVVTLFVISGKLSNPALGSLIIRGAGASTQVGRQGTPDLTNTTGGGHTLMGRFMSATGLFLLATYEHFSRPPAGSFSCPLTAEEYQWPAWIPGGV